MRTLLLRLALAILIAALAAITAPVWGQTQITKKPIRSLGVTIADETRTDMNGFIQTPTTTQKTVTARGWLIGAPDTTTWYLIIPPDGQKIFTKHISKNLTTVENQGNHQIALAGWLLPGDTLLWDCYGIGPQIADTVLIDLAIGEPGRLGDGNPMFLGEGFFQKTLPAEAAWISQPVTRPQKKYADLFGKQPALAPAPRDTVPRP